MADAKILSIFNNQGWDRSAPSPTNNNLNANNVGVFWVFQALNTDPITHLGYRYGARTGTPPTYRIGLQSVTGAGIPDGTILGGGTPASTTFTPPADATIDGLWRWHALANSYTPSRGQFLASCVEYSAGTVDASNFSSFTRQISSLRIASGIFYSGAMAAGTWAKTANSMAAFGWRTASGRYGVIWQSDYATNTAGTNGHRSAMQFTLPSGHGDTFKLLGIRCRCRVPASGNTFKLGLWDASSLLQSTTLDSDQCSTINGGAGVEVMFSDATLATLSYGTKYYVGFEVTSSVGVGMYGIQLAEAADRVSYPYGDIRGLSTYNGATWTDDDTVMPMCDLIFDDITEPAAGGGGYFVPATRRTN
jgi:hypothetical protein